MRLPDPALHWGIRLLALGSLSLFVFALLRLNFPAFVASIAAAIAAYGLQRRDVQRHPVKRDHTTARADKEETPQDAEAVYAPMAAGIPLSFETRSRPGRKKG